MSTILTNLHNAKTIEIRGRRIDVGQPCYLVAEIGINHNGDIDLAKRTILAAKSAGADAVKFQNYRTEDFITDKSLSISYENNGQAIAESQYDLFKRCELSFEQLKELKAYCDSVNISFHSTPTSESGLNDLLSLGVDVIKNGSDYLTHLPLIKAMGKTGLPVVLSTGMSTLEEIDQAVRTFRATGNNKLILLICTSSYPTPPAEVNLRRILNIASCFDCLAGFSDHTDGITAAIGAVCMGSIWIEKHFTLDHSLPGPDHRFSATSEQFQNLADSVHEMEDMMGNPTLTHTSTESFGRANYRLSCQTITDLQPGHIDRKSVV